MRVGDEHVVRVDALGFEGRSIARIDGVVIFVEQALAGDLVRVRLRKKQKKFFIASVEEIIEPSPARIIPPCKHVTDCGGCRWQHCDYSEQIRWKQQHTVDCFERLGKIPFGELRPIIPSPEIFHYRNKMEFSFSSRRWLSTEEIASGDEAQQRGFALGLHVPGRYDAIIDVKHCYLQHDECNEILNEIRDEALRRSLSCWNDKSQSGFLRHLVLRRSRSTSTTMIILISCTPQSDAEIAFVEWLEKDFASRLAERATVVHAIKDTLSPVAQGEARILSGSGTLTEHACGIDFRISPFSFFQTNSYQLENFLETVFSAAGTHADMKLWDLYCGTGSITLPAARRVHSVIGIELYEQSILDARHNAEFNELQNVSFYAADLHKTSTIDFLRGLEKPDCVIIDPPRAGVHEVLLRHLLDIAVDRIVYVSCNPATQARDCAILSELYDVRSMQAIDMFPHTYHVENVAVLTKKV